MVWKPSKFVCGHKTSLVACTQFLATYLPPEFALLRNGFSAIPMPAEDTPIEAMGTTQVQEKPTASPGTSVAE